MSTQACYIIGFGYKFKYDDPLFSFIEDQDEEFNFLQVVGKDVGYYQLRDSKPHKTEPFLAVVVDGMCGDYKYVLYIAHAHYLENTHGDPHWSHDYRNDKYVTEYAKENIETFLQRKLGSKPQEFKFEHWS